MSNLHKQVNGVKVQLSPSEVAAYEAQQVAAALVTKAQVNAEAKRRIWSLIGAYDDQSSNEKQNNLLVEVATYTNLVLIEGVTLSIEQDNRLNTIKAGNLLIGAIRDASNVLNNMDIIPVNFTDNKYWPVGS